VIGRDCAHQCEPGMGCSIKRVFASTLNHAQLDFVFNRSFSSGRTRRRPL